MTSAWRRLAPALAVVLVGCSSASGTTNPPDGGASDGAAAETGSVLAPTLPNDAGPDVGPDPAAQYAALPVSGGDDAPVVASISVRCAATAADLPQLASSGARFPAVFAQVLAVSDPQGVADIDGNQHQLVLFASLTDPQGEALAFDVETYGNFFGGSSFGAYFEQAEGAAARAAFCDKGWWPAEVTVTDETGHATKARVRIPVTR